MVSHPTPLQVTPPYGTCMNHLETLRNRFSDLKNSTVESHINESHIKDKSHINDVQAAYQFLLYV